MNDREREDSVNNDGKGSVRPGEEAVARSVSRGDFLKVMGAAGVGAAVGSNVLLREAFARQRPAGKFGPTELTFSIKEQYRPFDLLAKNFVGLDDGFDSDTSGDYEVLTPAPESNGGQVSVGGGTLRVSGDSPYYNLFRSSTAQEAPFGTVIVSVKSFAGNETGPEDTVFAGLIKDENNFVAAFYNDRKKLAGFDVVVDGQVNTLGTVGADLSAPMRFAFVLNERKVTVLADTGSGFRPLIQRNTRDFLDLRRPSVLAEYRNGFGARANPGGTIVLDGVEAGYYGEAGVRDPHVVTYADGTPYIKDNKLYLTLTQAGLSFFETAHWGVWTLDLSDYTKLEQVGNLFFMREGMDAVLGDHAGHIVRDEERGRWIVANSTWGDFSFDGVEVNYATLPAGVDLLNGVHIVETKRLQLPTGALPTAAVGQWDPHIVHIGERWYVSFVNASRFFVFYPAISRSPEGADFTSLDLVGQDAGKNATEGPIIQRIGGRWYVMASNGDDSPPELRDRYPVYDLKMRFVGNLNAPHPTNIPWPMVTPIPLPRGRTKYILTTFNGTQYYEPVLGYGTHGDFFVMEDAEVRRGYEFEPREP